MKAYECFFDHGDGQWCHNIKRKTKLVILLCGLRKDNRETASVTINKPSPRETEGVEVLSKLVRPWFDFDTCIWFGISGSICFKCF